ncbi:MAG: hypothetical protein PHR82_07355 [Endomicrobiaceae bacterium]|nr:hypothetical protein [Endomicrobiaceae bacterium]
MSREKNISIYLFGSILYNKPVKDVDVLFVYNSYIYPTNAYSFVMPLIHELNLLFKLPIHPLILSVNEVLKLESFDKYNFVKIEDYLNKQIHSI